jgi:hypothetical protein
MRYSRRIGLRLLLLLSILASLILAWLAIRNDLQRLDRGLASRCSRYEKLGTASGVYFSGEGQLVGADVQNGPDMDLLLTKYECSNVESIGIYSPDVLKMFQPERFPSVKKINLMNVGLTKQQLARFVALENLERIAFIQSVFDDLPPEWAGLARLPKLKYLVLTVRPEESFRDFPELNQLRTITLNSPETTSEQVMTLQQRLPNCTVVSPRGNY